jgi:hypothetical protein
VVHQARAPSEPPTRVVNVIDGRPRSLANGPVDYEMGDYVPDALVLCSRILAAMLVGMGSYRANSRVNVPVP